MQLSYWEKESFFTGIDVCVIGSGIVGLSAAIELKKMRPDLNVMVLERGFLPYGASTRNAGFACFGSVTELLDDLKKRTENEVFGLVEERWKGLLNLRSLLSDEKTGFVACGGYELFDKKEEFEKAAEAIPRFNRALKEIVGENAYSEAPEMTGKYGFGKLEGMIFNRFEGQVNTGKMMKNLLALAYANGVNVMNGVEVENLTGNEVRLSNGVVFSAEKIIITVNGFAQKFLPAEDVSPARAQVVVTSEIEKLPFSGTFHYDKGYYYFRDLGKRVLLGGGRCLDFEGEKTTEMTQTPEIQNRLEQLLIDMILPGKKFTIDMRWSGIMGVGADRKPIVKKIDDHLYCAVRMGGMGVAIGSLTGKEAAMLVVDSIK